MKIKMNHFQFGVLIAGLFILIIGCSSKKSGKSINDFPDPIELTGIKIFNDVFGAIYLTQVDSMLVISTLQEDQLYHVYDKKQNFISGFGKIGGGPGEMPYPIFIQDAFGANAFVYNSQLLKWSEIDLAKSIIGGKTVITNTIEFPRELSAARDIFFVDKELVVGVYDDHFHKRLNEQRGIFYYHPENGEFEITPLQNYKIQPYEVMPANNINARVPAISPDRSKLVVASYYNPLIEILDIETKEKIDLVTDEKSFKEIFDLDKFKDNQLIQYYLFSYATNQNIYLLYSGKPEIDMSQETKIQVLTWEGIPVREYIIPKEYGLNMFTVDESNKAFYGISYANQAIYKFDYGKES